MFNDAESRRLADDAARHANWKRWGPYLAERQWGTVREDYSADGDCWSYFPHDHARSRAYRWGEDGLLGICDRQGRVHLALALWNGRDPILKERLFGLTNREGNHGEDVKECYHYLDSTPTHSYLRGLYKYPQAEFPYARLVEENRRRGVEDPEFELVDTGVFDEHRYFDVEVEYAKEAPEDILVRIRVANRGPDEASIEVLPHLWCRNTWSFGPLDEEDPRRPLLVARGDDLVESVHPTLGRHRLYVDRGPGGEAPELLFTENQTNAERLFGAPNPSPHVKDAFHAYVIDGRREAVNEARTGTKAAVRYRLTIPAGESAVLRLRLVEADRFAAGVDRGSLFGSEFDQIVERRRSESDAFYAARVPEHLGSQERAVARQAYAGLLWSKQFYLHAVDRWRSGDPGQPPPPEARRDGRNRDWGHLFNRDVLSMPDTWEYPWYAAWDLAFHMIPFATIDPEFAKHQLLLLLREWYMHPNGQLPAYEFNFSDVNPPVHAWACWRVYKMTGRKGERDRKFLARAFHKLLLNFTWWVNRKDQEGRHIFAGGFLGLDNIGVFDRSRPLPDGHRLDQADGTAWMAFFCLTMLAMALELASEDASYEDVASKFFEHFVAIADAMNSLGGSGLWDEADGFYYDQLLRDGHATPLRIRSLVGLIPLIAVEVLEEETIAKLPGFQRRMRWFLEHRPELARQISICPAGPQGCPAGHHLLAIPSRERLERIVRRLIDGDEFLSPFGIRSLSRRHRDHPFELELDGMALRVEYAPGESTTRLFGGNSNWRGPIWFPVNYLLIEALERYHHYYGDSLRVPHPDDPERSADLGAVAGAIRRRLCGLFLPDPAGRRPCHGEDPRYAADPHWKDLLLFHEYFHGESGRGLGASHQTGWTALVVRCLEAAPDRRGIEIGSEDAKPQPQRRHPKSRAPTDAVPALGLT